MDERLQIALESQNPWWFGKEFETGVERLSFFPSLEQYLDAPEVLLLVGARRTGKSTLVYQIISSLLRRGVPGRAILFITMDEPLLLSMAGDPWLIRRIVEDHLARHPELERLYLCIDEVQHYLAWVPTIKTLYDTTSKVKCILTGSTSSLLRQESSRLLSGRCFSCNVYPLSFPEFLRFQGILNPTIIEKRLHFETYLKYGGFPRVVLEKDRDLKMQILKNYYETIYLKDIIYPNSLRKNSEIVDLLYYLISNAGNAVSYNLIARTLNIAPDTVREYIEYAENAFLLYPLMKFDYSARKQVVNPKKIYFVDPGLINAVAFAFSENRGRLLENIVFIALMKKYGEVFYHRDRYECDFLVRSGRTIVQAIQVTQSLQDDVTRHREMRGLVEAMIAHDLAEGTIVTASESGETTVDGRAVHIVSIAEWLEGL